MARNDKIYYENAGAGVYNSAWITGSGGWLNTNYRQITLEKPATGELKTWLEANAVRLPLEGTWVFNTGLTVYAETTGTYNINVSFTCDNVNYTSMKISQARLGYAPGVIYSGSSGDKTVYNGVSWDNEVYRTITFTEPVQYQGNEEFVKWFTANAKPGPVAGKTLNEYTWNEISQISALDAAAAYGFKVGDAKEVTLNGSVGYGNSKRTFSNQKYWVYIIGINHNEAKEGKGIAFQGFKTAQTGGVDIAVTGTNYNSGGSGMIMNLTNTNSGGWNGSWAYTTCMGQWKNCFPSDLQNVIRTTTLYTDNTGRGSSSASAVTANSNEVYYLAEYEVFGSNTWANANEPAQQAQYDYYKAGNSKVKYRSDNTSTAAYWWLRSPNRRSSNAFCGVNTNGSASHYGAVFSYGWAPCFKV